MSRYELSFIIEAATPDDARCKMEVLLRSTYKPAVIRKLGDNPEDLGEPRCVTCSKSSAD